MSELGPLPSAAPVLPPSEPPAAPGRLRRLFRGLGRFCLPIVRRPGRTLAVLGLLALILGSVLVGGLHWWTKRQLALAQAAVDRAHYSEAERHVRAAFAWRPHDPATLLVAARVARRLGYYDQADELLTRHKKIVGLTDEGTLESALLKAERGDLPDVELFLRTQVQQGHPQSLAILEGLASGYMRQFLLDQAEEVLRLWEEKAPESPQMHFSWGRAHELRGQQVEAVARFRRVLERDAERDDARLRLCELLMAMGQGSAALPHLEYLTQRDPDNMAAAVELARCRDHLGQQAEAEALLEQILQKWPQCAAAMAERGKIARRNDQLAEAERWYAEAVRAEPSDFQVAFQYAQVLRALGKTAQAREVENKTKQIEKDIEDIQAIVGGKMQRDPNNPALHYQAGMIALRAGNPKEALRWFESALRIDPDHLETHEALARYYLLAGQTTQSARHRDRAEQLRKEKDGKEKDGRGEAKAGGPLPKP